MKLIYLDSSAIVKLYVDEAFSIEVETLFRGADQVLCHGIGYIEVRAALAAARRFGRIDPADYQAIVSDFRGDWSSYSTLGLDDKLTERAAELAEGFALRGYDSVHLASADRVRLARPGMTFISFDKALNQAAKLLGLSLPDFAPY
ncbi:type II toxin-antitoxin system VapC family toxin [Methylocaldum sp.]|uniref:type II toxin-antitoxin system VapC family toxin n=1 Tax=Methylocaldum sp. TaxID=1969727 RepID=UPI002D567D74|nr:type II toxin-antitoxin system VapC family toxin [Methylocaldum sp.]HYE33994.1 type II toxin-antitoxin system VapC family toxin [Methylocaldum sp.]